ncbi:hypothetical protein [Leuconostoc citreum]|uniref:hypothetical protein n=1 Tax=Leuconostoc citreum TaxID=33964 RepID=UPI0021A3A08C|nr:hypothetical protein [Leuconostoc citreum]MCT3059072.1 hypothetical protein [Leuconostoc citreum]MCT3076642.1 hypothetical protein [Leuconostoc citreum]
MTNKEAYKKVSEKVIALLAEADSIMMNSSSEFDPHTQNGIEYEYFIQKEMFHGAIRSALIANSKVEAYGDNVSYMPLDID